jgi:hypothetical protein
MIKSFKVFKENRDKSILEKKETKQTVFTKNYLEGFLKDYGYTLNGYSPLLDELCVHVTIDGDKSKYDKMLNRMISLHYKDIKEVNTIKPGKEMKIYIKDPNA